MTLAARFRTDENFARELDSKDPLRSYRDRFYIPKRPDGRPAIYLCGNSLGLQPKGVRTDMEQEIKDWASFAVDAHFKAKTPWYSYHEAFRTSMARLVGAKPEEVVLMNSLTVNLHLMMATFYQPTSKRHKILMEEPAFPSDTYAVKTQILHHGRDPKESLIAVRPRKGEWTIRIEDIHEILESRGREIALVIFGGVNFFTGQALDIRHITAKARKQGCTVGWDLAHAAGNVLLNLHDWDVDFAVWCTYKYLNAGPGAVAGCFIHQRHCRDTRLPRLAGWWGNDPKTRFRLHLLDDFMPVARADGWQVSNPPIFSMAPLKASLAIFEKAGMQALRAKSELLTEYLQRLLDELCRDRLAVITPRHSLARGCQLSLLVPKRPQRCFGALQKEGIAYDFREPNVIRVAPVPLYNTFQDVWKCAQALSKYL